MIPPKVSNFSGNMPDRFLGFIILLRITTANTKSYKIKTTMNQHVGAVCPDFVLNRGLT